MSGRPKVALCLYGRFNNRFSDSAGIEGAKYIQANILDGRDVDVFIYSQDVSHKAVITELYSEHIQKAVFEELPDFRPLIEHAGIDENLFQPIDGFRTVANTLAFLYVRSRSLQLLKEAVSNGSHYDSAICCRFDLGQLDKVGRRRPPYSVSEINFNEYRDMSRFYSALWDHLNMGLGDQWFYSNVDQILKLEDMYDRALSYLKPGSDYLSWVSEGITDSCRGDIHSNEVLKQSTQRSGDLDSIPLEQAVHNHLLHKFFAIEAGLYEKSEFVSNFEGTAHVLYTHSSYSDLWPIYFTQFQRYFQAFSRNYVLVDKPSEGIPSDFIQIVYDESTPYVDRLLECLDEIPEHVIFFDHEDMFLLGRPDIPLLRRAWNRIRPGSRLNLGRLDFVRLVRSALDSTMPDPIEPTLHHLLPWSRWHFSVQPTFWIKDSFTNLLQRHKGQNIWDFESSAQWSVRKMMLHGATLWTPGVKRGEYAWENPVYPYIATAVSQGKWTTSEFGDILPSIFAEFRIDPNIRGEL